MHAATHYAYRCVQTCTPRNLASRLSLESDSVASAFSPASRIRLSQNCRPPAAVCNYACTRMLAHTGLLTTASPSSLSLSLSPVAEGLRGLCFCCRCITITISTAASIQMHTNAHTCIHIFTPFPLCSCFVFAHFEFLGFTMYHSRFILYFLLNRSMFWCCVFLSGCVFLLLCVSSLFLCSCASALRVPPAETRLTVYRRVST